MATLTELEAIRRQDPDGKDTEPTEEDYLAFKEWVLRTYGKPTWDEYNGNWDGENA